MYWVGILICTLLILGWLERRWYEERVQISSCLHKNMTLKKVKDMPHLYLQCQDCPKQCHVRRLSQLPDGTWFYWWDTSEECEVAYLMKYQEIISRGIGSE